jgi:hypothetical protein
MPKTNARGRSREDDLIVEMHEVDPEEADNEDLEEDRGGLTEVDDEEDRDEDRDQDDLDDEDKDTDEDDDQDDDEEDKPVRRQQASRQPSQSPRDKFLKRLKRAERQIAEVRDENASLAESNQRQAAELQKIKVGGDVEKVKKESEAKLEGIRAKLKVAVEAGDSDAQVRLTEELADVKAEVKKAEALAEASKGTDTTAVERYQRLAAQWKRKHQRFTTDKVFAAFAAAVDRDLAAEGLNRNSDGYFKELDKRIKERYPEEYGRTMPRRLKHPSSGPDADEGTNRRPIQRRGDKDGNFSKRGKAFVLSAANIRTMRAVGLDPDDKEDQKTFVRENQ